MVEVIRSTSRIVRMDGSVPNPARELDNKIQKMVDAVTDRGDIVQSVNVMGYQTQEAPRIMINIIFRTEVKKSDKE